MRVYALRHGSRRDIARTCSALTGHPELAATPAADDRCLAALSYGVTIGEQHGGACDGARSR
jgi:hypothetical protein